MEEGNKGERLHRFLARAGIGSRRTCEEYIEQGRVSVDGVAVSEMGVIVDPTRHKVRFDGELVGAEPPVHYLVYKPKGVVCTTKDQFQRSAVVDLVRNRSHKRLFPVGRMEEDSEGLILVTNDGDFANRLAGYKCALRQTYWVKVRGKLAQDALDKLREGLWLSDGRTGPMWVEVQKSNPKVSTLVVSPSLHQHRLLRRAFAKVGASVEAVIRIRIGPLTAEGLKKTGYRRLGKDEVAALLDPPPEHMMPPLPARRPRSRLSSRAPSGRQDGRRPERRDEDRRSTGRRPERRDEDRRSKGRRPEARRGSFSARSGAGSRRR